MVYLLAIFFIVIGAIEIIKAIILLVKKAEKLVILIISMIFGAIFIAGGILSIIFSDKVRIVFCFIAALILIAIGLWLLITGIMTLIGGIKGKSNKPVKKEKEKKSKQKENQFDEEVEYEAPQELDYTADVPALEEKKEEPSQEVIDAPKEN